MIRTIMILFFILISIVALCFSLLNFQFVDINLYFTTIQLPLVVALTVELFAGICIGFLVAFINILKLKSDYKYLSRQVEKAKESAELN